MIDADEQDALNSNTRKLYQWRGKQLKKIKRAYNKRLRRALNKETQDD